MGRPSLRFRLSHLGIAVTFIAAVCGWVAHQRRVAMAEARALRTVQLAGGVYDSVPTLPWHRRLTGYPKHSRVSVRLTNLGTQETWGPYGPGGSLVRIRDWNSDLFDELGAALSELDEITSLSFQGTRIAGHADKLVPGCGQLGYLSLEQTGVRSGELKVLRRVPNLQRLSLRRTPLTDEGLAYVEDLSRLELLDISSTEITDHGLAYLARLPNLKILRLENTQVTDVGLQALRHHSGLQELDLGLTLATPASVALLERLRVTDRLVVPNSWAEADVERLEKSLPGCEVSRSPYPLTDRSQAGR